MTFAQPIVLRLISLLMASAALLTALLSGETRAEWPERTITVIVPFSTGGTADLIGRLLAKELAQKFGQSIVVENRVGEGGDSGLRAAASIAPNGYTLVIATNAALIRAMINPSTSRFLSDPFRDLAPVAYLGTTPDIIVTGQASGIASIADLIAKAKAEPGKLTYASPGSGTSSYFAMELLKLRAKIEVTHIPFDGSGLALTAVVSGSTNIAAIEIGGMIDRLRSSEIKGLVQTGGERWFALPDVPTMAEAGVTNMVVETAEMLLAPAGTPEPIIQRLTQATREVLQRPDITAKLLQAGIKVQYEGPDDLRARVEREIPMWKEIIERARQ
jgi:tripartite-type tricarboxylate transporter receptor subunit TctC